MDTKTLTPPEAQAAAQKRCGYGPIQIVREDDCAVVRIHAAEMWVEIHRVFLDANFCDTIYPVAIQEEIERRMAAEVASAFGTVDS